MYQAGAAAKYGEQYQNSTTPVLEINLASEWTGVATRGEKLRPEPALWNLGSDSGTESALSRHRRESSVGCGFYRLFTSPRQITIDIKV
jgi:hypothetical protein